jgi:hypothetical protein
MMARDGGRRPVVVGKAGRATGDGVAMARAATESTGTAV